MKHLCNAKKVILSLAVLSAISTLGIAQAQDIVITNDADYAAQSSNGSVIDNSTGNIRPKDSLSNNTVTLGSGGITTFDLDLTGKNVYGALGDSSVSNASLSGNKVTYISNVFCENVYGAYTEHGTNLTASGNSISIDYNSACADVFGAYVYNGNGTIAADNNTVTANNSSVDSVTGGSASGDILQTVTATANNNTVTITNSDGDCAYLFGGVTSVSYGSATSNGNTVIINNSTVLFKVHGGEASVISTGGTADASGNTVTLAFNQTAPETIYGGYAVTSSQTDKATANNNIVNIYDNPDLSGSYIYGGVGQQGVSTGSITYNKGTGNTLNVYTKGLTVANVGYFNNYNFYLPANTVNGDTILTIKGTTRDYDTPLTKVTDLTGVALGVSIGSQAGETVSLQNGDKVTLIHNDNGITTDSKLVNSISASQDIAVTYNFLLSSDANNVYATLGDSTQVTGSGTTVKKAITVNPRLQNLLEGRLASFAFLQNGSDILLRHELLMLSPKILCTKA